VALGAAPWSDVHVIRAHPDATHVAIAAEENVILWDFLAAKPVRVFTSNVSTAVTAISFSKNGSSVAVGRADGRLELWDISSGRKQQDMLGAHVGPVAALDYSWPGQSAEMRLFSGGHDGSVRVWLVGSGGFLGGGPPHARNEVHVVSFHAGGNSGQSPPIIGGQFTIANLLLVVGVAKQDEQLSAIDT